MVRTSHSLTGRGPGSDSTQRCSVPPHLPRSFSGSQLVEPGPKEGHDEKHIENIVFVFSGGVKVSYTCGNGEIQYFTFKCVRNTSGFWCGDGGSSAETTAPQRTSPLVWSCSAAEGHVKSEGLGLLKLIFLFPKPASDTSVHLRCESPLHQCVLHPRSSADGAWEQCGTLAHHRQADTTGQWFSTGGSGPQSGSQVFPRKHLFSIFIFWKSTETLQNPSILTVTVFYLIILQQDSSENCQVCDVPVLALFKVNTDWLSEHLLLEISLIKNVFVCSSLISN